MTRWTTHAACRDGDPEVMFPTPGDTKGIVAARAVCATCPVARECLIEALQQEGNAGAERRHGIRGGATPKQRRRLYEKYGRTTTYNVPLRSGSAGPRAQGGGAA